MTPEIKKIWNSDRAKMIFDVRNIVLYVFSIIAIAITWSGVRTVQTNYELQKKVAELRQQNDVTKLENENMDLQNKYFETDEYLEIAARQNLGLAAPGEKALIVPREVAMKYIDPTLSKDSSAETNNKIVDNRSRFTKNLEDWRDFLLGRKLFDE
jgi:cell division protein FtsB